MMQYVMQIDIVVTNEESYVQCLKKYQKNQNLKETSHFSFSNNDTQNDNTGNTSNYFILYIDG